MKSFDPEEKAEIKIRYAIALNKAFKASGIKSLRKLASLAGMEHAHLQKITKGMFDVTVTTNVAISKALGITYSELAHFFDDVTENELKEFLQQQALKKEKVSKPKKQ